MNHLNYEFLENLSGEASSFCKVFGAAMVGLSAYSIFGSKAIAAATVANPIGTVAAGVAITGISAYCL
jgi:hypothetical protein